MKIRAGLGHRVQMQPRSGLGDCGNSPPAPAASPPSVQRKGTVSRRHFLALQRESRQADRYHYLAFACLMLPNAMEALVNAKSS